MIGRVIERVDDRVTRVATADGEVAVKRFAAADAELAEREAALLVHLESHDPRYRVQAVVRAPGGALVWRDDNARVLVTRWVDGRFKPYTEITRDEWRALGRELAALHDRLATFARPLPRLSEALAARDLDAERAELAELRARAVARRPRLADHFDARVRLLDACAATPMPADPELPIHDDFNQFNYRFDGTLPPVILDWEGAIGAPREYEVVRCLAHLPLVEHEIADAFVAGYRGERALDPARLAWAVDAMLVHHALKRWAFDRWLAGADEPDAAVLGNVELIAAFAGSRDALLAYYARA